MKQKNKKNRIHKNHFLFTDTSSTISEAFQQLQVNLNFSFIGESSHVVTVTSALAGEGKSTICSNLAYIYAKKDYKVLVIDLDLRKPSIHHFFGLSNDVGVTDYCSKSLKKEDIIKHYENIDIITAGSSTLFPGKILESTVLSDLINSLKDKYDFVFVDTPPVLVASDAIICSKFTSQYVIVVDYGKSRKADFNEVMRLFRADSTIEIGGVVFNRSTSGRGGYYYYKGKYYNYRYGRYGRYGERYGHEQ